jgi:hypothetical protein
MRVYSRLFKIFIIIDETAYANSYGTLKVL